MLKRKRQKAIATFPPVNLSSGQCISSAIPRAREESPRIEAALKYNGFKGETLAKVLHLSVQAPTITFREPLPTKKSLKAMKTLIRYGVTAIVVGVAATTSGQNETPNASSSSSSYIQASKLVGRKVTSSHGREIGVLKDVVIDRSNGCMAYTVVSTGGEGTGVASGGGKIVAIPWAVYSLTSDLSVLRVNVDRDKIYNAPAFDYARMDEYARPDYLNNVYSYYGVSPGPRTAVAGSSGSTAGTDVTETAGATAPPGEVASPAAAETASPNKGSWERTHAASAATPEGVSSEDPSPKAIRHARAISSRPLKGHNETASPTMMEESPSGSTASPSENKRSRRKANEDTSTNRPSSTPESAEGQD
jgi:sporulation protein YlmC with PRC-barrel domain